MVAVLALCEEKEGLESEGGEEHPPSARAQQHASLFFSRAPCCE